MREVQVLSLDREVEWTGDADDLIAENGDLSEVERRWIESLEVGQEFRVGGSSGAFLVRRVT